MARPKKYNTSDIRKESKLVESLIEEIRAYRGNPQLKRAGEIISMTPELIEEYQKCMKDPVYFAERYIKVVHVDRGLIPIRLYDYQKRVIKTLAENRFSIVLSCRQSGKSTMSYCFLLWYVLFHEDKRVAILANKAATSRQLLGRLQLAYYNLPKWLQQGIADGGWNKGSIALENGSSIITAATSSDSIRGESLSVVYIDECAFVPSNIWDEFYKSTYPTISSGKETRLILTSTPNGENHFYDIWRNSTEGKNVFKPVEVGWQEVPGRDDKWREETISNIGLEAFEQEFNNSFQVNNNLLLSMTAIHRLSKDIKSAVQWTKNSRIYEEPKPGHLYFCACDCADIGIDYSTIQVVDVTEKPYKQVAVFQDNKISYLVFPQIIVNFATLYNMAEVLVENNSVGVAVLQILNYEIEYDNIAHTFSTGGRSELGIRTTTKTKTMGCSLLKTLIETSKLDVIDKETVNEFKHFAIKNQSYAAEEGYHDDLVMGLVIFSYYASTPAFGIKYDKTITDEFTAEYEQIIEQEIAPLPVFTNPMYSSKAQEQIFVTDVREMSAEDREWLLGRGPDINNDRGFL